MNGIGDMKRESKMLDFLLQKYALQNFSIEFLSESNSVGSYFNMWQLASLVQAFHFGMLLFLFPG